MEDFLRSHESQRYGNPAIRKLEYIMNTYVLSNSDFPINISSPMRKHLESLWESLVQINPKVFDISVTGIPLYRKSTATSPNSSASSFKSTRSSLSGFNEWKGIKRNSSVNQSTLQMELIDKLIEGLKDANKEIIKLMYFDSFYRFKRTDEYSKLVNSLHRHRVVRASLLSTNRGHGDINKAILL